MVRLTKAAATDTCRCVRAGLRVPTWEGGGKCQGTIIAHAT